MKIFKRNQIIIYVIALMIMAAGYLNYSTNVSKKDLETSLQIEAKDDTKIADIGDATLVNSNDVVSESSNNEKNDNNTIPEKITEANNEVKKQNIDNIDNNEEKTLQTSSTENSKNEYFIKSKLERETMYSQMIETYEKVLNSSNSLEMQKQTATQEIQKINGIKNSIMISENLLKTKGFEKNVIFVNGESISVIIGVEGELKHEQIAQVQNIISREMNAKIENIHIATK